MSMKEEDLQQTKWEDLPPEEKVGWNKLAKDNYGAVMFWKIMRDRGCFMCGYTSNTAGDMQFHLLSTHGIYPETLPLFYKMVQDSANNIKYEEKTPSQEDKRYVPGV